MRFFLQFDCDNAVFDDYPSDAIADALLKSSKDIRKYGIEKASRWIVDNNGNRIGSFKCEVS